MSLTMTTWSPMNAWVPVGTAMPSSRTRGWSSLTWVRTLTPAASLGPGIYSYCSTFSRRFKPLSEPEKMWHNGKMTQMSNKNSPWSTVSYTLKHLLKKKSNYRSLMLTHPFTQSKISNKKYEVRIKPVDLAFSGAINL